MAENYDDTMAQFTEDFAGLAAPDLILAGIYANKAGYHNKRKNLPASDYSVSEFAVDRQGPDDMASAIDMTSKKAQAGDYGIIKKYSGRLYAAGQANDPRTHGWREFFGQTDDDGTVEGWDFAKKKASTSADKTHLWHIHLSEHRGYITSKDNKMAMLSILKGETLEQYLAGGGKLVDAPPTPTPTPPAPPASTNLKEGSKGDAVTHLQQFFKTVFPAYRSNVRVKRGQIISVDGSFGPQTTAWVKEFQRRVGIAQDGIVGPVTLSKLRMYGYKY